MRVGSVRKILELSAEELVKVPGIGRKTAEKILAELRRNDS